jgi:hypothetical protein
MFKAGKGLRWYLLKQVSLYLIYVYFKANKMPFTATCYTNVAA